MMGLNTSHGCWDGSYSTFAAWRRWLANRVGIPLMAMEGFGHEDGLVLEHTNLALEGAVTRWMIHPISWDVLRPDPIYALLNHSDCDGELALADLPGIARRLREIADRERTRDDGGESAQMIQFCDQFASGCLRAIQAGENVDFH